MVRLLISGATGQTGGEAFAAARADSDVTVTGILSRSGAALDDVPAFADPGEAAGADAVIDFSAPTALTALLPACIEGRMALVTGTTGLNAVQQQAVKDASHHIPIVQSGNFSLGVNLLAALVREAAAKLDAFDIEIVEAHHRRKADSPSGTALMIGRAAAQGRGVSFEKEQVPARTPQSGARKDGEIGFAVVRGGGVFGDHDAHFMAEDEVVTLSHRSLNRRLFGKGAVAAAKWAHGKPPGLYSMADVLGL